MSEAHELTAAKIANYYNQDIYIKNIKGEYIAEFHPKVFALKVYLETKIEINALTVWYNEIIKTFDWFPKISELERIMPGYKPKEPESTIEKAQIEFIKNSKFELEPSNEFKNIKSYDMINDWYGGGSEKFLAKYGIKLCTKFLRLEGGIAYILGRFDHDKIDGAFKLTKQIILDYYKMDDKTFIQNHRKGRGPK